MTEPHALTRRTLLTLGAAALLSGCAPEPTAPAAPAPSSPAPPAVSTSDRPATTPDRTEGCPTYPDVLAKPGNPQQYLPCRGKEIALTIDDGPHPVWTPKVLDLLARHDIQATFCVVGANVAAHPGLIARLVDGGHQIANHTFSHPMDLAKKSPARIRAQIDRATEAITTAGGAEPVLFRAPGGTWSAGIIAACADAGLRPLDWSIDTRDWARPGVQAIVDTILTRTRPGAIILDHDGGGNRQQTVEALTTALPRLLDAGYTFVHP